MRSCFGYGLFLLFSVVAFPAMIFLVAFSTLGNPVYIKNTIIPGSYNVSVGIFAKRLEKEIPDIQGQSKQDWFQSVFPKDTYVNILRETVDDTIAAFLRVPVSGLREIDYKNTKRKLLGAIENALRSLPVCAVARDSKKEGFPTCYPKEIPPAEKERGIKSILADIDAGIPSRLTFKQPPDNNLINGLSFVFKNRFLVSLFVLALPVFFLLLITLLLFPMKKRLLRSVGNVFLVISFQSFMVIVAITYLASIVEKMKDLPDIAGLLVFLGSATLARFQWISIGFAALGVAGWIFSFRFKDSASGGGAPSSAGTEHFPRLALKNGKARRGSTHQFIPF